MLTGEILRLTQKCVNPQLMRTSPSRLAGCLKLSYGIVDGFLQELLSHSTNTPSLFLTPCYSQYCSLPRLPVALTISLISCWDFLLPNTYLTLSFLFLSLESETSPNLLPSATLINRLFTSPGRPCSDSLGLHP